MGKHFVVRFSNHHVQQKPWCWLWISKLRNLYSFACRQSTYLTHTRNCVKCCFQFLSQSTLSQEPQFGCEADWLWIWVATQSGLLDETQKSSQHSNKLSCVSWQICQQQESIIQKWEYLAMRYHIPCNLGLQNLRYIRYLFMSNEWQ